MWITKPKVVSNAGLKSNQELNPQTQTHSLHTANISAVWLPDKQVAKGQTAGQAGSANIT